MWTPNDNNFLGKSRGVHRKWLGIRTLRDWKMGNEEIQKNC